ncbi:preprotein translocase subunit SecF [Candidatus Pacearchaeota archaeon]|nr:preprotein translocase subunit SecF [Candidatus Pacearchaeota archaeon]
MEQNQNNQAQGNNSQVQHQHQNHQTHSTQHNSNQNENKKHWYDRWYKRMLLPPVILLIICLIYLFTFYSQTGDIIYKDSSLSGGTTITLKAELNIEGLKSYLEQAVDNVNIRKIADLSTGKQIAILIDSSAEPAILKPLVEEFIGYKLTNENSSVEFSGSTLGKNFYKQLVTAVIISFILMSFVIFVLFRTFIPSIAVIFAAFADIVMTLAMVDILGIRLSVAGIAAFLMLIGYSVDTDILLTSAVLKKRGDTVNKRIHRAFKTGIFMTLTGLVAVIPAFFIVTGLPDSFRQIFLILGLGLFADIINTWLTNASIIKWYSDYKKMN